MNQNMQKIQKLHNILCELLPAQFEQVVVSIQVPRYLLSHPNAPAAMRASEVIDWAKQDPRRLEQLERALAWQTGTALGGRGVWGPHRDGQASPARTEPPPPPPDSTTKTGRTEEIGSVRALTQNLLLGIIGSIIATFITGLVVYEKFRCSIPLAQTSECRISNKDPDPDNRPPPGIVKPPAGNSPKPPTEVRAPHSKTTSGISQEFERLLGEHLRNAPKWSSKPQWRDYIEQKRVKIHFTKERIDTAAEMAYRLSTLGGRISHQVVSPQMAAAHQGELLYSGPNLDSAMVIQSALLELQELHIASRGDGDSLMEIWLF